MNWKSYKILLLILLMSTIIQAQRINSIEKIELTDFVFRKISDNNNTWLKAKVPGCVHTDLLQHKIIENPYYADNEQKLQWIEKEDWEYKTEFQLTKQQLQNNNIDLVFEGLDTYADIFINGKKTASCNNMFRKWIFGIKEYLKVGKNEIKVYFHSPYNYVIADVKKYKVELPAGNDRGEIKTSVFTRKAPYHYGWDWGPRFATSGIWRPVYIEMWNEFKINDYYFQPKSISNEKALYNLNIEILNAKATELNCNIKLNYQSIANQTFITKKGKTEITIPIEIQHPKLWWPNGYGEPYLYDVTIELNSNKFSDTIHHKLGVRSIKLSQEKDSIGEEFSFVVNGKKIFMKGANYIPMDNFLPNVSDGKRDSLLKMVVSANMNMLRVWGGGIYEDDKFYELCDKYGIMVWQDFMFACSLYPLDSTFLYNVKYEAIDNIKRLRNHACISLWCGNNEMSEAWFNWGWQKQYKWTAKDSLMIWNGYNEIFEKLLPSLVTTLDSQHSYISSSPKLGWGRAESYKNGDSHYWGVWWGMAPIEKYKTKVGRFASEYGFQALPNLNILEEYIPKEELKIDSKSMRNHQKHSTGFETIETYRKWYFPAPKNFKEQIYISQLLQAYGIKTAIETHRSNKPYCMGTLYWQLNDCWPSISWSGIDYNLEAKALHYQIKRSYKNIIVCADKKDSLLQISIVSDSLQEIQAELKLTLLDFYGNVKWTKHKNVNITANSVCKTNLNYVENFNLQDSNSTLLKLELTHNGKSMSESYFYFCLPKHLTLPKANIKIISEKTDAGFYKITIHSDVLAKDICIRPNTKGELNDNYFDLLPNQKKELIFKCNQNQTPSFEIIILNDF